MRPDHKNQGLSYLKVLLLLGILSLSACSPRDVLKAAIPSSGTNVAANVPIGKEVRQTLGVDTSSSKTVTLRPKSKVDLVDQSETKTRIQTQTVENLEINTEIPYWFIGLFLILFVLWSWLLWILPSPDQIFSKVKN